MSDSNDSFRVIVSHVGKHSAFQAALAAVEAGVLDRFLTTIYYKPNEWPYSWLDRLSAFAPANIQRLHSWREEHLVNHVTSLPWLGLSYQAICRLPLIRGTNASEAVRFVTFDLFDRLVARCHVKSCDIFHSYRACSMFSLEKANALGATTVLDHSVIHIDSWLKLESEECARLRIRPPKKPVWFNRARRRLYRELELADFVFVNLEFVKKNLVGHGIAESKIFVQPRGVNIGKPFQPVKRSGQGPFTILYVGIMGWPKGLSYLLDAYERLKIADARLIVVGREHPIGGQYFRDRFAKVQNLEWIPGVSQSELFLLYADADAFVFPSLVGGLGLVVFEAMSTGLPVIVSDGDVVIRDGIDGLVAFPQRPGALEEAIIRLYHDRDLRLFLGQNGIERAKQFSRENYRRLVVQDYQKIMEGRSSRDEP